MTRSAWCRSRDCCLNFNPFNISGGMRWGGGEKRVAVGVWDIMFRRIPRQFLNDAWIYSDDCGTLARGGRCHASHYLVIIIMPAPVERGQ